MAKKVLFSGSGGDEPHYTPDNLKSEDIVEFALAVSEGPIRGLTRGAFSFFVGDTPLVSQNGQRNFDKFAIGVHPGYPEGSAKPLNLKLGGVSSNTNVGVQLLQNVPVTRQTESHLRNAIDELEVRIHFARLVKNEDVEGVFENTAKFKIEYKPSNAIEWTSFVGDAGDGGYIDITAPWYGGGGEGGDYNYFEGWLVAVGDQVTQNQVIGKGTVMDILAPATGKITELAALETEAPPPSDNPDAPLPMRTPLGAYMSTPIGKIEKAYTSTTGEMYITGKTSSGYFKEFRATVPRMANDDWVVKVTKLSPDNDPNDIVDMSWADFQCTTKENRAFPDTAIVHGLGVANGQFSSIPEFGGVYDGLLVRVPTNYNPDLRTYDESTPWNGSFKFAWTNNPAWILYDMIVNDRYGLAKHRRYIDANRFTFYQAAKWCDMPVKIGNTDKTRPRYTFNAVLSEPRPAMEMLNYVAGSFNALVWDDLQGQIHLRVDKDEPAVMMFSPENITEEGFGYTFTDITSRANDLSVTFINPDLDWNEDRRRIPNVTTSEAHIERYGRIPLDFIAVGCTDLHEAIAKAQVRLISALTETTMVNFTTTRQGALLSLYDVILIADPTMGWSQSGRLTSYDSTWLNFRDPIYIETMQNYKLKLQTVTGVVEVNVQPEQIGHVTRLKLMSALPANIPRYTVFTLEGTESYFGYAKPFRVMSIEEVDGSPYLYRVNAIEINRNKYVQVEGEETNVGEDFDYSTKTPYLPGQPTNFSASSGQEHLLVMPTGEVISRIFCSWRKPFNSIVKEYVLQYKLYAAADSDWQTVKTTATSEYLSPVIPGSKYTLRLAAVDKDGKQSNWIIIKEHTVIGKQKVPLGLKTFTATGDVFQNLLKWEYHEAPDIRKVEIWASGSTDRTQAVKMTDLSYPTSEWTHMGLDVQVTVNYWARVQDTSGNYSLWSSMVSATTLKDPRKILEILENQITESQLYQDLQSRIDLVDGPVDLPGSVAHRIKAEATAREAALLNAMDEVDARILTEINARVEGDNAITQTYTVLATKVNNNTSAITQEQQTRSSETSSLAYSISILNSNVADTNSRITNESNARANADSAIASNVSTLSTTVNGHTSSIQTLAQSVDGVRSQYFVKVDAGGRVAGFGIANDATTGSEFIVLADRFAIGYPGYGKRIPFMVGNVNGQSVVGINGQLVVDGTLTVRNANIENAAVDRLKIAGQSVTIPQFSQGGASSSGSFERPAGWPSSVVQCNSLSFYLPEGCNVLVLGTVGMSTAALDLGIVTMHVELYIDNSSKLVHGGWWWQESISIAYGIWLPAGWHSCSIATASNAGGAVDNSTLYIIGAMR